MVNFDYVSDLHIETLKKKINWKNKKSDILIIAGDVSNDINLTAKYIMNEIYGIYKTILFIDGNHEHDLIYPNLYNYYQLKECFRYHNNIIFLPDNDYIINKTVFIGCCGWWNCKKNKKIFDRANFEFNNLIKKIEKYEKDNHIDEIIIVTHTVPLPRFYEIKETDFNENFIKINYGRYKKVVKWVFGHVHKSFNFKGIGIKYISNPRGNFNEDFEIKYE